MTDVNATNAILSADRYDPPKAREYKHLMSIIDGSARNGDEVYNNLMNTESRVLDTVDRVVNDSRLQQVQRNNFLNMSLLEIAGTTAQVMRDTYLDLVKVRSARDFVKAFTKRNRRIYLGLVLVVVCVTLLALDATSAL